MRKPSFTGQFRKDRKRALKRGWDVAHLHVEPDFLLIWYYAEGDEIVFVRTGSHADLFDE